MRCQICGAELRGALCPDCGFDRSLDRERYPTLINDGRRPEAVWVFRQRLTRANADAGTRSPGSAGAPPDAGAKAPSAAPPARQQPIDLPRKPQEQPIDSSPKPREQPAAPAKARKQRGLPFLLTAAALVFVLAAVLLLPKGTADPTRRASTPAPATEAAPTAMPTTPTATPMPTTTPTPAPTAEELLAQGYAQSEDGLFWKVEDGVLTICGEGRMADYTYYGNAPWFAHREAITRVTIAKGVTSIGEYAFYRRSSLSEIAIPASVTSIGEYAFTSCSSLREITIPASVTSIGEYAFVDCSSLSEIKAEEGNTCFCAVDGVLFSKDKKTLICFPKGKVDTSYRIPDQVTQIADDAFCSCSSLKEITIPKGVTSIGECAFEFCSGLSEITIPEGVTSIGEYAFTSCSSLREITIPASVTSIGEWAFYWCDSLTDVNFAGTRAQWENIKIGDGNEPLLKAAIHYDA